MDIIPNSRVVTPTRRSPAATTLLTPLLSNILPPTNMNTPVIRASGINRSPVAVAEYA
ncbi:hypothetical protein D3C76_1787120 [compost metagenome]